MNLQTLLTEHEHEQLVVCSDRESGLFAFIAIHDTTLGPALGGCRMWSYPNLDAAVTDALRLSRGMTYKASLAGLDLGGGKAVILGNPKTDKSESLFRMFGQFVDSLGGRYITAEDVGTNVADMAQVMTETRYAVGGPTQHGGSGDPSPFTALGVFHGIRASLVHLRGDPSLRGVSVAVQGVGHVGSALVGYLIEHGANVFVSDIDAEHVAHIVHQYPSVNVVAPDRILGMDVDVFSPCALGAVINDDAIKVLRAKIIAGSANNQLQDDYHGEVLSRKGILYAPDYCINAGGLINVYMEHLGGYDANRAKERIAHIYDALLNIYRTSESQKIPTSQAADLLAQARISRVRQSRGGKIIYKLPYPKSR